jgi:hypothetical protein
MTLAITITTTIGTIDTTTVTTTPLNLTTREALTIFTQGQTTHIQKTTHQPQTEAVRITETETHTIAIEEIVRVQNQQIIQQQELDPL